MKNPSGNLIGGSRIFNPEMSSAANARPNNICEAAIENKTAIIEAQVR